jgi:RNA polymerase sigma factor (sigma-70 family)
MTTDLDLLGQYAGQASEPAFAELVRRHVNLVYSAALRQVRSPQLAEEVAQSVFTDLARNAARLNNASGDAPVLTAWLYQVTRRTAIDVVRKESRRQLREQIAVEMNTMNATSNDWTQIEPLLDEAMDALEETDRAAILLRYFENKNLREVGESLGTSDDTAQKRVSRAVERLREFFTKRGVTVGASGLAVVISANAVQAAPVGLATTISTAAVLAGTSISTSTAIATAKAIAMTTLQKSIIGATLAVVAGTGIYEAHQASQLRNQIQTLQQAQAPLAEQIRQLERERDDATNRLALSQQENAQLKQNTAELLKLRGEMARLKAAAVQPDNDSTKTAAQSWLSRVDQLKQRLTQDPDAKIPELQFVTEQDWLNAARGELKTEADYRRALSALRNAVESKVVVLLKKALKGYLQASHDQMPTDLAQLQPYFDSPMDDAILQRWEIAPAETVKSLGMGGDVIITQKAPVDDVFDTRFGIGPNGYGSADFLSRETAPTMNPVWEAFRAAHNGQWPDDVSQLQPYATTPEQQAALQKLILKRSTGN